MWYQHQYQPHRVAFVEGGAAFGAIYSHLILDMPVVWARE
jgi:hypothetical protein